MELPSAKIVLQVLEHFMEEEMYQVLIHLLKLTSQCLIIDMCHMNLMSLRVPMDGHKQLFVPEKLKAVGQWCIDKLGEGSMSVED